MKHKKEIKWTLILVGIGLIIVLLFNYTKIPGHISRAQLEALDTKNKLLGSVVLWLGMFISALIPGLPTSVVETFIGLCAGPLVGILINWSAIVLAQWTMLKFMHVLEHKSFKALHKLSQNKWFKRIQNFKNPLLDFTLAYINPIFPPTIVTFGLSEQKLTQRQALLTIILGTLPGAVVLSIGGDAVMRGDWKKISLVAVILLIFIGLFEWRHHHNQLKVGQK